MTPTGDDPVKTAWWCGFAWLPGGPRPGVRITAGADGRIITVEQGVQPRPGDVRLDGLVLPGFADAHSHAFHRALRGRTHGRSGTFWSWRRGMYALAERLTPQTLLDLATAVYSEMVLAGVTCVGEFHYLHHGPGGARYADPNEMGHALREAARRAGLRLTLLDTCYLRGGIDVPLEGVQRRFGDGDADRWADRVAMMAEEEDEAFRVGAAIHSVRAVPADQLRVVAGATESPGGRRPLHVHVSEQPAENRDCLAAYGVTPTRLLAEHGVLGRATTAVHATHLTGQDIELLGGSGTAACLCPTTEQDLADGIGPARRLAGAGSPLCLGSDQHARIDLLGEASALELHERLATGRRGHFTMDDLVTALTSAGHAALGRPEGGRIEVGALCDLVALRLDTVRTAGSHPDQVPMVASAADVDVVVVAGRTVVDDGVHLGAAPTGGVPGQLAAAIAEAWGED